MLQCVVLIFFFFRRLALHKLTPDALALGYVWQSCTNIDHSQPQDQLAEGLHMIDFEQLKINNVDLNEKIEGRNEDIMNLKRKVTATVQVLTHVKEKLQFLQVR